MGFARTLGNDCGIPQSEEQTAFNIFMYWLVGGLVLSLGLQMLIFPSVSFLFSILFYLFGVVFLFIRYLKIENRGEKCKKQKK